MQSKSRIDEGCLTYSWLCHGSGAEYLDIALVWHAHLCVWGGAVATQTWRDLFKHAQD